MGVEYKPVGFSVTGTPFAKLPGNSSRWHDEYNDFNLGFYCDGYIYTKPFSDYEMVKLAPGYITENNKAKALEQTANPKVKILELSLAEIAEMAEEELIKQEQFNLR